jgi:hypothetical protein
MALWIDPRRWSLLQVIRIVAIVTLTLGMYVSTAEALSLCEMTIKKNNGSGLIISAQCPSACADPCVCAGVSINVGGTTWVYCACAPIQSCVQPYEDCLTAVRADWGAVTCLDAGCPWFVCSVETGFWLDNMDGTSTWYCPCP